MKNPNCAELVKSRCLACHHETRICRKVKQDSNYSPPWAPML